MRLASLQAKRASPNQALQRTAATVLVCQGVESQRLPRPLSLGVRRRVSAQIDEPRELSDRGMLASAISKLAVAHVVWAFR